MTMKKPMDDDPVKLLKTAIDRQFETFFGAQEERLSEMTLKEAVQTAYLMGVVVGLKDSIKSIGQIFGEKG